MSSTEMQPQEPEPIVQPPVSEEHLAVLADAVRDDSEYYDDPPLTAA